MASGSSKGLEWPDDLVERERKLTARVAFLSRLVAFTAVIVIICAVAVILSYRQNRIAREQLLDIAKATQNITTEVESCTVPTGDCYRRGNENRATVYAFFTALCNRQNEIAEKRGLGDFKTECPTIPRPMTPTS